MGELIGGGNILPPATDAVSGARGARWNRVMRGRVEKKDLVRLVSQRVHRDVDTVEEILDATLEEIYQAIKRGESVSLRNFGSFYVRPERESWVFKFNPSQRLRKLFGWTSTYRGEL
jgi:DNA-binding protein HU-beta